MVWTLTFFIVFTSTVVVLVTLPSQCTTVTVVVVVTVMIVVVVMVTVPSGFMVVVLEVVEVVVVVTVVVVVVQPSTTTVVVQVVLAATEQPPGSVAAGLAATLLTRGEALAVTDPKARSATATNTTYMPRFIVSFIFQFSFIEILAMRWLWVLMCQAAIIIARRGPALLPSPARIVSAHTNVFADRASCLNAII
jgi:hypothetical protein